MIAMTLPEYTGEMHPTLRLVIRLMGTGFALLGIGWLVAPGHAAGSLGMPLLDGLGRSTQVGDFAAFFLTLGVTILAGSIVGRSRLLYFPATLLACAAGGRILAWAVQGAAFAALFIAVEILSSLLLLAAARHAESW